ncbi:MAG: hypothetical protein GY941_28930 [Planctomycetes bacterium]|nr:hypothetical protein [Planctomycetota bacterium]
MSNSFSIFYQYSLLFHIFTGLSLIIPLVIYLFIHSFDVQDKQNSRGKVVGIISFIVITIACATGAYQTFVGFEKDSYWISYFHTWVGFASVLIIVVHIVTARFGDRWGSGGKESTGNFPASDTFFPIKALITIPASCLALFLSAALLSATYSGIEYKMDRSESYTMKYGDNPFHPSEAMTVSGDVVDARLMGNSLSCSSEGWHEDIYRQWYSSAHRYSSTEVFYRKAEQYFVETDGKEATRYCAGCHDPVALLSGGINPGEGFDTLYSKEGSSCIVCHAITKIRHLKGSGSYLLAPHRRYMFENREGWFYEMLGNLLIKTAPEMHRKEYSRTFYDSSEYCAVCHK